MPRKKIVSQRTKTEDEFYVTINHKMTKEHYISSIASVSYNGIQIKKLYPEENAEARFKISDTKIGEYLTAWRIPNIGTISGEKYRWNIDMLKGTLENTDKNAEELKKITSKLNNCDREMIRYIHQYL